MPSVSVRDDGFLRQVGGAAGAGNTANARPGQKPGGGVVGKRQPVDEYIASLPAQVAIIGGRTLETLTSLPPLPQPQDKGANGIGIGGGLGRDTGIGIGVNTIGRIGAGVSALGGTGIGINNTDNTINAYNNAEEPVDTKDVDETDETDDETDKAETENKDADNADTADKTGAELSPEEQGVVNELRNRDREVRAHEQAHVSAGGAYIRGGPSYQYQRGPDNKSYAVGGEVSIDSAPEPDDPGATITKMQAVRSAALAPADPSAQDRAVAASAARNESVARSDLAKEEKAA